MLLKRMAIAVAATGLLAGLAMARTANAAVHTADKQAATGSVIPTASPLASAPETFRNMATGRCITAINDGVVEGFGCSTEPDEEWLVSVFADGTRMLQNETTGSCLGFAGPGAVGLFTCDTRVTGEHWFIGRYATGAIRFQNAHSFGCIRDRLDTQLSMTACNDSFNQRFT